jgi:pimeloyl-ACP methyl ester carboxylesterase
MCRSVFFWTRTTTVALGSGFLSPARLRGQLQFGLFAACLLLIAAGAGYAKEPAPNAPPAQELHWLIPYPGADVEMHATMLVPSGKGPFPLAVVSHGTSESETLRQDYEAPAFEVVSSWLARRGYAVLLPQRPGHGETGGRYLESSGSCDAAQYEQAGEVTAEAVRIAIDYAMDQHFIRRGRVVLVGHSAGAWGSLALAALHPELVRAVINFAGGRGGHSYGVANRNCAPERLVQAAAAYGSSAKAATLWLYSQNDSFFGPQLSREMAEAFRAAGGSAEYHLLPAMPGDGHYLIFLPEGAPFWGPIVDNFLKRLR